VKTTPRLLLDLIARLLRRSQPVDKADRQELMASLRARDPQENIDTSPPEGEHIDLCCVWGMEFYTHAHLDGLVESFRNLGWHSDDHTNPSRDPEAWLRGSRRLQHGSAWLHLGYLISKDSDVRLARDEYIAPLPGCVKYARVDIYSISPSLMAVVLCFVFRDDAADAFDRALRKDRISYLTPIRNGWKHHDPRVQKTEHITQIRTEISQSVRNWFSENLPGVFSSGPFSEEMPTCEFTQLRTTEPFPPRSQGTKYMLGYMGILDMGNDFDVWKSSKIAGLKFRMPRFRSRGLRYHSMLALCESQGTKELDSCNNTDRETRINQISRLMPDPLCLWSILPLLSGYMQHLNEVRDSVTSRSGTRQAAAKILEELESQIAYSVDVAAVTSELKRHLDEGLPLLYSVDSFEPCDASVYGPDLSLEKHLESSIGKRTAWLQTTDKAIRDHLTQYGSLLGAAESVRMQRTLTGLTWALFLFGGGTLAVALVALFK